MADQANPVGWFEIPVNDLSRAKRFYEQVLGLAFQHMDMGPASMEMFPYTPKAAGAAGALIKSEHYTPSHTGTIVYFTVPSIEDTIARVLTNGGKTLVPKMSIGEHGFVAHFEDSEGNRVALHSMS